MRSEKELWEVVLSRLDLFELGLCIWITKCYNDKLISLDEIEFLLNKLDHLRTYSTSRYWIAPKYELQPRIDWINERIKQL